MKICWLWYLVCRISYCVLLNGIIVIIVRGLEIICSIICYMLYISWFLAVWPLCNVEVSDFFLSIAVNIDPCKREITVQFKGCKIVPRIRKPSSPLNPSLYRCNSLASFFVKSILVMKLLKFNVTGYKTSRFRNDAIQFNKDLKESLK